MQHALAALLPASLPRDIPRPILDTVRAIATRAIDRRMSGRPADDREDVTQVAVMHALGSVCWDGADPADAAAMSARTATRRFYQDAQSNGRELPGGGDVDLDSLSGGSALGVANIGPAPDHMTRSGLEDVYADAMADLESADPVLHGAMVAWLESARSQDRRGSVPTLKGMLGKRVREILPPMTADIILRNALQSGTAKPFRTTCAHVSCRAIAALDSIGPVCRWDGAERPGGAFGIRDRSESGTASPVVSRKPIAGPACEECGHGTCEIIRGGRYARYSDNEAAILGLTGRTGAYRADSATRAADDWAYAQTPTGPVRKSSNRKGNKGGGAVGTSTTMRGPRHAWGDKSA